MLSFLRSPDIAIDVGTAFTRLSAAGRGIVSETRSRVVTRDTDSFAPLCDGVVIDVAAAAAMLAPLIASVRRGRMTKPRVIACVPGHAGEAERQSLEEALRRAGAGSVAIVSECLAAAIGARLEVAAEEPQMIVDVGDGVTEIAVVRNGEIVRSASTRVGCGALRRSLIAFFSSEFRVRLEPDEADRLIGISMQRARKGTPEFLSISASAADETASDRLSTSTDEVLEAIGPTAKAICDFAASFVQSLPEDISASLAAAGACVSGGGACLPLLVDGLREATGLHLRAADQPLHCVVLGATEMLSVAASTHLFK